MRTIDNHTWRFAILVVLIPSIVLAAWPQGSHLHSHVVTQDPNWTELMGAMNRMHTDMASAEPSGDSDVDFVKLMLPHHQAAIDMAKTQLMRGKDPQVRRLAQEILTDQDSEIQLMQLWLKQRVALTFKPGPKSNSSE
jgi:uncharacterized protein (DUF305 family)